jgi:hypothetical protein
MMNGRKRGLFLLSSCATIFLMVGAYLVHTGAFVRRETVDFREVEYDAGTVTKPTVQHSFQLKNNTRKPVLITGTKSTCGCTVVQPSKTNLLPGEDGQIEVELTLGAMGFTTRQVAVYLDSVPAPVVLTMKANYLPRALASAMPTELDAGVMAAGGSKMVRIKVDAFVVDGQPVSIAALQVAGDTGSAVLKETELHKNRGIHGYHQTSFALDVTVNSSRAGDLSNMLTVAFSHPELSALRIPMKARVVEKWAVVPRRLILVLDDQETSSRQWTIDVQNATGASFSCSVVSSQLADWLNVKAVSNGTSKWELQLKPSMPPPRAQWEDVLQIAVEGDGRQETIDLPVIVKTMRTAGKN